MTYRSIIQWPLALALMFLVSGGTPAIVAQEQTRPPTPTEAILDCWMNTAAAGKECMDETAKLFEQNLFLGLGMGAACAVKYALDTFLCVPARLVSLTT